MKWLDVLLKAAPVLIDLWKSFKHAKETAPKTPVVEAIPEAIPEVVSRDQMRAFLDMIAYAEGTDNGIQPTNNSGYDVLVGGNLFYDYSDHPRVLVSLPKYNIKSTAAGRYQILARYYDAYKLQLGLKDFGPESQDKIAMQMVKECKAVDDIKAGRIEQAIYKCRSRWASLPGAGYGQHEQKMSTLVRVFNESGYA